MSENQPAVLDFEKKINEIEEKIKMLNTLAKDSDVDIGKELNRLQLKLEKQIKQSYANLTPWQRVQIARHPERPQCLDYIKGLIEDFVPLSGDRLFADDATMIGGIGRFKGISVVVLGQEKGRDLETRVKYNFGMAKPEGYRKAQRLMSLADKFNLPVIPVIDNGQPIDLSKSSYDAKEGKMINSGLIDGMEVKEAIAFIAEEVEKRGIGKSKINYRLRDAIFSRQRYWGEPFPVYYKDSMPYMIDEAELPLELPEIDKYLPTENGEPPLGRAKNWTTKEGYPIELNTMPGFAGSSAYYLRYMDPHNDKALVSHEADAYWRNVDLYLGGAEHATGHLIYSRFWNMFLYDLGVVCEPEPFKKLINQGMIQGRSNFVYRIVGTNTYVSAGLKSQYETTEIHVDVNIVKNDILDTEAFRKWMPDYADAEFILEDGKYICGWAVEKMSKSMFNVVNPDDIIEQFGADTLRLYEMFLGPLEAHKPWDTQGIDGVYKFLRKFWRLFLNGEEFSVSDEVPTKEELKVLHKTLKKIEFDIENFSFNTSIPAFMICTNELAALKCNKRAILEPLVVAIAPYAPHIAEELWHLLGHAESVTGATFPQWEEKYLVEDSFEYPVSFNGKVRFKLNMPLTATQAEIEAAVKASPEAGKWLEGKEIRKMIIVPKKIVNVVIA